ncbi:hypothetical protein [Mucilaginibacter sp. SG564]|uniref:hypothetical protein n=1 Tax=Mucilaginibacter sp. SG564 TaxID=2587022 RepID=UPI0015541D22|nr:hypothetical protein [Mucilaginibacter sp. SG564]NOW94788.1 hypothetical protein [Mucilaginibacter sp. SG564]
MKYHIQNPGKKQSKYLFILPVVLALYLNAGFANAQQSKPKDNKEINEKPVKLTTAQLAAVAGKYQYMDSYVTITPANGGIVLKQLQGQGTAISFYPTDLYEFHTRHFGRPYWIRFGGSGRDKSKTTRFLTIDQEIWVKVK